MFFERLSNKHPKILSELLLDRFIKSFLGGTLGDSQFFHIFHPNNVLTLYILIPIL